MENIFAHINSSLGLCVFSCIATFFVVLSSYLFLFKRRSTVKKNRNDGNPTEEKTVAQKAGSDTTASAIQKEASANSNGDNIDAAAENIQKLPKPKGMCPFAAMSAAMSGAEPESPHSVYEHIPSKIKRTEKAKLQREVESHMTEDEKVKEREIQQEQMRQIFELMSQNQDNFGMVNKSEMEAQMNLYM